MNYELCFTFFTFTLFNIWWYGKGTQNCQSMFQFGNFHFQFVQYKVTENEWEMFHLYHFHF